MKTLKFTLIPQGPRNGFQLTGAQSAISAGGGCLNQAPSPWPQIGPKLMGAWHPLLKIDGCTGTRSYEDPASKVACVARDQKVRERRAIFQKSSKKQEYV